MAHITTSGIIGEVTGTLGTVVFARTPSGLLLRNAPSRAPRSSPTTLQRRARVAEVAAAWTALTDAQVAAWVTAAKTITVTNRLSLTRNPTARALFFRVNLSRAYDPGTICTALLSPQIIQTGQTPVLYLDWISRLMYNIVGSWTITATTALLWGARTLSKQPPKYIRSWTWLDHNPFPLPGYDQNITTLFVSRLGTPQPAEYIALKIRGHKDGHLPSLPLVATCPWTPT